MAEDEVLGREFWIVNHSSNIYEVTYENEGTNSKQCIIELSVLKTERKKIRD